MRTNTSGALRDFLDNYRDCDGSWRLRSAADVGVEEHDLLTCWNKVLMTVKQKYLLACCMWGGWVPGGGGDLEIQPQPLKSLDLCCQRAAPTNSTSEPNHICKDDNMLTAGSDVLGRTRFDGGGGAAASISPTMSPPTLSFRRKRQKRDVTSRHGSICLQRAPRCSACP